MFEKNPKEACVNCHFFVKQYRGEDGDHTMEVAQPQREKTRQNNYDWLHERYSLMCSFQVWDEGYRFDKNKVHELLVETNRADICFFWRFRPSMLLPAAKTLQAREAQDKYVSKDRKLTVVGLWVAATALMIDVYLRLAEIIELWPYGTMR